MDELLEQFLIEGRELVAQGGNDLAALAHDPQDAAAIDSAFRAFHTLKGSVALFAMQPAERLLHAAEDILERARKGANPLDGDAVTALLACLDQTDRWIDDMERQGALPGDAQGVSERIAALLTATPCEDTPAAPTPDDPADWIATLMVREASAIAQANAPLTAFRYTPDPACFFRGEDPLSVVEAVPDMVALAILPVDGAWPASKAIEAFSCFSILEGLSAASLDVVRAAFRLQPDQVQFAPIAPVEAVRQASESHGESRMLRVDSARLDAMADGLGDLIVAINSLTPLADTAQQQDRALALTIRSVQASIERAAGKLHRDLSAVRMVPLAPALRRLPRIARETADSLGKAVTLTITGETLEVDKQIADGLFEPLLHLLRNAIDHGLETPDQRRAVGKDRDGSISLSFQRSGDTVIATLSDDGAGIDPHRVRQTAIARGLITQEAAAALSDAAALRLILLPGFSTAATLTEVSGRGVGMDAVQAAVARLRGTVEIESIIGKGTRFSLHLPANALTTRLLVVEVGPERYGVSLDQVLETVRVDRAALMPVGGGLACVLRDRTIPLLDLAALLHLRGVEGPYAKLLITQSSGERVALRVDGFGERIDTVVRPATGVLASARGVIGSALLGDGSVLLVLDLPELAS
ncbi:chemotaxis protein CheA [Sphingobium sufflavum]|uniref:chemotaxis protein CheA n=1 Tax=Sphingobium sufflavum TaxID=1129547 RepID=UPI001F3076C2|nr:chemotaxis protein CheA [Sphingobium sufflavum]MCE7798162.1 chemotaxis protein CheA [Sphingobium sufflavum]